MPDGHPAGRSSQAAGRFGIGCGVPPRQTQVDNIASSNPQRVKASHIRPFLARQVLTTGKNKTVAKTEN